VPGLGEEIGRLAGVETLLTLGAQREQALAGLVEASVQIGDEGEGVMREDFVEAGCERPLDDDAARQIERRSVGHGLPPEKGRGDPRAGGNFSKWKIMTITFSNIEQISFSRRVDVLCSHKLF